MCFLCWSRQNLKIHTTIKIAGKWIRVFVPLKIVIVFIVIECYWSIHNLRSPSWFVRLKHFLLMGLGPLVLKADPAGTRPLYSSHAHLLSHEKVFFLSTSLFMFDVLPKAREYFGAPNAPKTAHCVNIMLRDLFKFSHGYQCKLTHVCVGHWICPSFWQNDFGILIDSLCIY